MSEIQPTNNERKLSTSLYDVSSSDDIFASVEEVQELAASGGLGADLTVSTEGGGGEKYDNSWARHRRVKFGKQDRFVWEFPLNKELLEEGYETVELNESDPNHHFVAFEGVPISFNYGFRLSSNNGMTTVCNTCSMVETRAGMPDRVTESDNPLPLPLKSPFWSRKKSPDRPNWVLERNPHLELQARRRKTILSTDEDGKTVKTETQEIISCLDCIRAKDYTHTDDNGFETVCSVNGYMLFAVTSVGIKDVTAHLEDPVSNPITVRWVDIKDAGLKTWDGTPLDKPFIIRVEGLGSSQLNPIGKGQYDIPVILPEDIKPKGKKTCYLPSKATILSTGEFYNWLTDPKESERFAVSKQGNRIFTTLTQMYIAPLTKEIFSKAFVPVFVPVATGRNTEVNGVTIGDYVKTALLTLNSEKEAAENRSSSALSGSTTKSIASSTSPADNTPVVEAKKVEVTDAEEKIRKKALDAFSV